MEGSDAQFVEHVPRQEMQLGGIICLCVAYMLVASHYMFSVDGCVSLELMSAIYGDCDTTGRV